MTNVQLFQVLSATVGFGLFSTAIYLSVQRKKSVDEFNNRRKEPVKANSSTVSPPRTSQQAHQTARANAHNGPSRTKEEAIAKAVARDNPSWAQTRMAQDSAARSRADERRRDDDDLAMLSMTSPSKPYYRQDDTPVSRCDDTPSRSHHSSSHSSCSSSSWGGSSDSGSSYSGGSDSGGSCSSSSSCD